MTKEEKRFKKVMTKQLRMNGYWYWSYEDLKNMDSWYRVFITTEKIKNKYKKWLKKQFKKRYGKGVNEKYLDNQVSWLILYYGFRIKNDKNENNKN